MKVANSSIMMSTNLTPRVESAQILRHRLVNVLLFPTTPQLSKPLTDWVPETVSKGLILSGQCFLLNLLCWTGAALGLIGCLALWTRLLDSVYAATEVGLDKLQEAAGPLMALLKLYELWYDMIRYDGSIEVTLQLSSATLGL